MIKEYEFTCLYLLLMWGLYMQSALKMQEEYTCLMDAIILWPVLSNGPLNYKPDQYRSIQQMHNT